MTAITIVDFESVERLNVNSARTFESREKAFEVFEEWVKEADPGADEETIKECFDNGRFWVGDGAIAVIRST